ncbi:MAG: sensor histidine kinase [Bacteroidia bacterium]
MPNLVAFLDTLYHLGIQANDPPKVAIETHWHNRLAVLITLFLSLGCLPLYFIMPTKHILPIQLAIFSKLIILLASYAGYRRYASHLQSLTHLLVGFSIVATFGKNMDLHYVFAMAMLYTVVIRKAMNIRGVTFLSILTGLFFALLWAIDSSFYDIVFVTEDKIPDFQNVFVLLIVSLLCMVSFQFVNTSQKTTKSLLKSENLLHQKLEELEKTNQELDRFIYSVSHDLRSPLASALGLIDLCRKDANNRQIYFNLQEKSLKKLDNFIQDILLYSQNVNLSAQITQIDLNAMVQEIFESLRFEHTHLNIQLTSDIICPIPFYSDKFRLQIILANLIGNSIRYHNPQANPPFVKVVIRVTKEKAQFEVKDNGIGISDAHLPQIFDMFYRAHTQSVGSGLGLYIVNEAIKILGGKIKVKSILKEGSVFLFHLPNVSAQVLPPLEKIAAKENTKNN